MPYLIDGYNLLRAVQKIDDYADLTDVQLCRCLGQFLRAVNERGTIVFDGIGPPDKRQLMDIRGVEICFSGQRSDADSCIERKIEENTAPRRLVVVSSDRRLRTAAVRRKAKSVPVDEFWPILCRTLAALSQSPAEPREKRSGITDGETDAWMDVFDLDV